MDAQLESELREVMAQIDRNGDEEIDIDEFMKCMNRNLCSNRNKKNVGNRKNKEKEDSLHLLQKDRQYRVLNASRNAEEEVDKKYNKRSLRSGGKERNDK